MPVCTTQTGRAVAEPSPPLARPRTGPRSRSASVTVRRSHASAAKTTRSITRPAVLTAEALGARTRTASPVARLHASERAQLLEAALEQLGQPLASRTSAGSAVIPIVIASV